MKTKYLFIFPNFSIQPGPIPGMRPPMGAGALHQPQQRGSSMGFLMPLYTIGIVVFFGYTIMKVLLKLNIPNPYYYLELNFL